MKYLILIAISLISANSFASQIGEDQKSECPFLNQSSKRNAKVFEVGEQEVVKEATKVISK